MFEIDRITRRVRKAAFIYYYYPIAVNIRRARPKGWEAAERPQMPYGYAFRAQPPIMSPPTAVNEAR
jgi:hypothetical protein